MHIMLYKLYYVRNKDYIYIYIYIYIIMHNYHVIYVLIYYSGIRVKNLNFGLKNTVCIIIITVYY